MHILIKQYKTTVFRIDARLHYRHIPLWTLCHILQMKRKIYKQIIAIQVSCILHLRPSGCSQLKRPITHSFPNVSNLLPLFSLAQIGSYFSPQSRAHAEAFLPAGDAKVKATKQSAGKEIYTNY